MRRTRPASTTVPRPRRVARAAAGTLAFALVLGACSASDPTDDAERFLEPTDEDVADEAMDASDPMVADEPMDADEDAGDAVAGAEPAAPPSTAALTLEAGELTDDTILFEPTQPEPVPTVDPVINPFVDTAVDAQSTFAMDVDTASWTQTLSWLDRGQRPPLGIVRPEEFLNWFDYGYASPDEGWAIATDGVATTPWNPETALLRVGLTTADITPEERPDATMTFVVDTSGSMSGTPLETVKGTLLLLLDQLRPTDRIGLVEYGSQARVLLEPTELSETGEIRSAIEDLETNGSTYAEEGLRVGYELASRNLTPNGVNVVVLASDGVANVGLTDPDGILGTIDEGVELGINLLALGITDGQYNDFLMEQLANRGNGSSYFVRDLGDARRLFVDNLESTFVVVAKDSKVQVEFSPDAVRRYRLIGYENRNVADEDFRNDAVDAGEVGAGHEVTALYELELQPGLSDVTELATVRVRWEDPLTRSVSEVSQAVTGASLVPDADTGFGTAVQAATLAELLRGSPHVDVSWESLAEFSSWGTSNEALAAILLARDANPAPGS